MLDFSFSEMAVVAMVALLVIGPKELPNALRHLGRMTGKARAMTRHVRSGFDEMVRQAEMEEMEKQWKKQNEDIMAAHPAEVIRDPQALVEPVPAIEPPLDAPELPKPAQ